MGAERLAGMRQKPHQLVTSCPSVLVCVGVRGLRRGACTVWGVGGALRGAAHLAEQVQGSRGGGDGFEVSGAMQLGAMGAASALVRTHQSLATLHFLFKPHDRHVPPPQSTSVSCGHETACISGAHGRTLAGCIQVAPQQTHYCSKDLTNCLYITA